MRDPLRKALATSVLTAAFCGIIAYGSFSLNHFGSFPSESLREWKAFESGANTAGLTFWIVFPLVLLFPRLAQRLRSEG
ncbi:MAG TPA: hypothetical protein VNM14_04180 [Planctomycetota bacterium]|nr:hypothetical protein [Planctomycetota bacterium]